MKQDSRAAGESSVAAETYYAPRAGSSRNMRVDALRGIAIVLVVLGHAAFVPFARAQAPGLVALGGAWVERAVAFGPVFNIAYSVHMPLFAFLSGFVLFGRQGSSSWKLITRRFGQLLVPYVVWVLVAAGVYRTPLASVPGYVGRALLYPQTPGAPWFLYALFGSFCIFAAAWFGSGRRDWALLASAAVVGLVSIVPITRFGDIIGIYDIAWLYPFLIMGWFASKHSERLSEVRGRGIIVSTVAYLVLLALLWPVMAPTVNSWYPALRQALQSLRIPGAFVALSAVKYSCAAAGIMALFWLFESVSGSFGRVLAWLGSRTLGIYVSHRFVIEAASRYTDNLLILTGVSLACAIAVTLVLERWKWTRSIFLGAGFRSTPAAPATDTSNPFPG